VHALDVSVLGGNGEAPRVRSDGRGLLGRAAINTIIVVPPRFSQAEQHADAGAHRRAEDVGGAPEGLLAPPRQILAGSTIVAGRAWEVSIFTVGAGVTRASFEHGKKVSSTETRAPFVV
jgi:hypothetical protein